ncbi:unnamed protein product [Ostreobium quekettii]|uniref:Phage terminase large subunit N-terminal domain-containing protein n=1 Tax=Ostreobium quekettii TaxID=121088 RepID=A0A8S1IV29_9CHLO|nr:unnamed protein product [Ostreobium quekettii]CAD7698893.1 unnamed protein product [Ostreobium quekettii]CAD7698894.1 unnamed protein product [Ostreobium quekettii]
MTTAATQRLIEQAWRVGLPPDQLENFLSAGYVAQPKQMEFHAAARLADEPDGPDEVGFGGARGPGKSHAIMSQVALDDCRRVPGLKALYLRKVGKQAREQFDDLRRSVLRHVSHKYNRNEGVVTLWDDSRIFIGHFKDEKDVDNYLGIEYDLIAIEECTTLTLTKYRALRDSNRTSKPGWRPRIYNSTNPGNIGHAWYKQKFIAPARDGCEHFTRFVFATVDDNQFIDQDYKRKLEENTGVDVFAQRGGSQTIAEQYAEKGIQLQRANTDRINGAAEVLRRLGDAENGIRQTLFIFNRCRYLIECIPAMEHDPNRPEDVLKVDIDEDGNGGDDCYDSCRYGLMAATSGGSYVLEYRRYYEGLQDTFLTARLKEFLNAKDDHEFNLNVCRTVIEAVEERLIVTGVSTNEPEEGKRPVAVWADGLWDQSRCALLQQSIYEGALRDGEYFVLVDWDSENQRPRFTPHQRFVDSTAQGDGFGCKAHYPDDDTNQPLQYISKRWIEKLDTQGKTRSRMTLYFPDRVEKYQWVGSDWVEFQDEGDGGWPIRWVDKVGQPLGIAGVHFPNTPDLRPEHWDSIPLQKAINKLLLDLLAAGDVAGFRLLFTYGWIPTTDGQPPKADNSNLATIAPGKILGTNRPKSEAGTDVVPPTELRPLIEAIQSTIGWLAIVTSTPESRLSFTRQIAAEGTLQEQNEGLFAKIRKRKMRFDAAWQDVFALARKLDNTFGNDELDEDVAFIIQWEPVQSRDTEDERDEWRAKKELGVPLEVIWREMGYSPEEIAAMKETEEYQARVGLMQLGLGADEG